MSNEKFTVSERVQEIPVDAALTYLSTLPRYAAGKHSIYGCEYSNGLISGVSARQWRVRQAAIAVVGNTKRMMLKLETETASPWVCLAYYLEETSPRNDFDSIHRPKMEKAIYALKALGFDVNSVLAKP